MLAREIMTTNVITIKPDAKIYELTRLLAENHISGLPVVDEAGRVVGIVTEADLLALKNGDTVKSIMSREVIGVDANTPVEQVAAVLSAKKIKRVPVFQEGRLIGIISRSDLVNAMSKMSCMLP